MSFLDADRPLAGLNMRTRRKIPTWWRNLSRRLPRPAGGRGRVQRACQRASSARDGLYVRRDCLGLCAASVDLGRSASERLQSGCQARPRGDWRGQGRQGADNWSAAPVALAECGWQLREKETFSPLGISPHEPLALAHMPGFLLVVGQSPVFAAKENPRKL